MRQRILRAVTYLVIFFFTWTMGGMFNIAYAAYYETQKPISAGKQAQRPEEKFQKAMDDLRGIVSGKLSSETRKSKIREKRDEIESLDKDIKGQFADTENKLNNAGLPQEILQRHYNFVKHYEDNLKELRANLDAADQAKTDSEFEIHAQKIRQHLERSAPPRKHTPLDPNKLPHRISDIKRKEPRTTLEEFQKDLKHRASAVIPRLDRGIQKTAVIPVLDDLQVTKAGIQEYQSTAELPRPQHKPGVALWEGIEGRGNNLNNQQLLLASNGPLTGLVEKLPKYEDTQNLPQPLFYPKGHTKKEVSSPAVGFNSFNSPPFLKGDTGGFSTSSKEPITLALAHDAPTSADLDETIDVQLTPAIKAKAAELNYSPVKIYNWVRNNVEYVPTYGSIQGADMCLQTMQGNDFDIASLLIALLRASGIHARYVYGTIELPIEKVMNWLGGFTNANAAISFIASGGTPVAGLISGGKISSVRMEHVWVEAFVKFYPMRGARHITGQGDSWIPLDASYKQYTYTQGVDIKSAVPFDAQTFVNQIQSTATIDEANSSVTNVNSTYIQQQMQSYQAQVKTYIEQNYPNATVGDVLGKKEIIKQNFSYLLGTLPYRSYILGVRYSEIPDSLRHKITFKVTKDIYDEDTGTPINITKRLPEIAGKKITLSYSPATANDEATINSYLPKPHADGTPIQPSELPTSLPAYLINLKPELRIDGVVVATGTAIGMGYQETFDMVFTEPHSSTDVVSNQIDAGAYHAIAIDTGKISEGQLLTLKSKIEETKEKIAVNQYTNVSVDDIFGDGLYVAALSYYMELDAINNIRSKATGIVNMRMPSESIFSTNLNVDMMFGLPRNVSSSGFIIDVDRNINTSQAIDGSNNKKIQFMVTSGMNSSALEHSIPEQLFSMPENPNSTKGISAVKALKLANEQGIPIVSINKANVDLIVPQLKIDTISINEIKNAVNAGNVVTVSKADITYNGWTGCGYIIINPSTGAGAYMISGSFNGGFIGFDSTNDCEKSYLENAINNFVITNNVLPGILAPWGLSMLLKVPRAVASMLGTITLWEWAKTFFAGAVLEGVAYTALETGILVAATALFTFALVGISFEIGAMIGSLIVAGILPCRRE